MSSSHRSRHKHKKSVRLSLNNDEEFSSARTRPSSYEEIMLRRKRKSFAEDLRHGVFQVNSRNKEKTHKPEENHPKDRDSGRRLKSIVFRPNDNGDGEKDEIREHIKRESDKLSTDNNESGKKYSRELRESKRKYQNGDDEKPQLARTHETENSGRSKRKESSKSHLEEVKTRRDRDVRIKRSNSKSPSTRDQKRTSYKDRSGKQNHIDRNKLSNTHYRRHDESTSGLGGYSPRKRIPESAAKNPLSQDQSSEKKSAKWDIQPPGAQNIVSNIQLSSSIMATNVQEMPMASPIISTFTKLPFAFSSSNVLTKKVASVDTTVQLTQATRPMRRLYVENLPSSISEKALVEWFNDLLLSSGVNHIQGTKPCINCIINKEKSQALAEFLTPEDASTALSFDGNSISGYVLKIRRPKDFVEVATGELEKSTAAADTISDVVKDSPNKIFIGGISKVLSSKMLMEIVSVFGPLKAYRFESNDNLNEPCAFLEYVDQSTALKACAGLNGMKLGGKVITVVRAIHGDASLENTESSASYEIPDHAKPLLRPPTQVLKLKNAFTEDGPSLLSKEEVEEIIEDTRQECARFGDVKSVNIVSQGNSQTSRTVKCELDDNALSYDLVRENNNGKTHNTKQRIDSVSNGTEVTMCVGNTKELQEDGGAVDNYTDDDKNVDKITEDKPSQTSQLSSDAEIEGDGCESPTNCTAEEFPKETAEDSSHSDDKASITVPTYDEGSEDEWKPEENSTLGDADSRTVNGLDVNVKTDSSTVERDDAKERVLDTESIFEAGCVFVEFGRTEAACMAAHCLHGRVFDGRIVSVDYVSLDHYKARFPN